MKQEKLDAGKPRMDLIPPKTIINLAKVLTFGLQKYPADNWRSVEVYKLKAAALRHLYAYLSGEIKDPESGMNHLYHAIINLMFVTELENNE